MRVGQTARRLDWKGKRSNYAGEMKGGKHGAHKKKLVRSVCETPLRLESAMAATACMVFPTIAGNDLHHHAAQNDAAGEVAAEMRNMKEVRQRASTNRLRLQECSLQTGCADFSNASCP